MRNFAIGKTQKPLTKMRKVILIGLCIVVLVLIMGAGKRFYLSQYEEVCEKYQMNVTADLRYCTDIPNKHCESKPNNWTWCYYDYDNTTEECEYSHRYIQTDNCLEYKLVRKVDIEPFVYLFDWCTVYPNSVTEDCSGK